MIIRWLANTIVCDGTVICYPVASAEFLPLKSEIAFRAKLLFNAWQAHACDGRQMSPDDLNQMEHFDELFADDSHSESSLADAISAFGRFIPAFLLETTLDVPTRALQWSQSPID